MKLQLISYAALAAALPIHPAFAQAQPLASASDTAGGSAGSADASGKPTPGNAAKAHEDDDKDQAIVVTGVRRPAGFPALSLSGSASMNRCTNWCAMFEA